MCGRKILPTMYFSASYLLALISFPCVRKGINAEHTNFGFVIASSGPHRQAAFRYPKAAGPRAK